MHKERPLSPHLQIYRPQLTSMLSIMHRLSGVFLSLGLLVLVFWVGAIAAGPEAYSALQASLGHGFVKLFIFAWTFAVFYHLGNGIRYLFWDVGKGFEIETLYRTGWIVLISAIVLTVSVWWYVLSQMGGWS